MTILEAVKELDENRLMSQIRNIKLLDTYRDGGSKLIEVEYLSTPVTEVFFVDNQINSPTIGEIFLGMDKSGLILRPDIRDEIKLAMVKLHI